MKVTKIILKTIGIFAIIILLFIVNILFLNRVIDPNKLHINLPIEKIVSYDAGSAEIYAVEIWDKLFRSKGVDFNPRKIPHKYKHLNPEYPLKWNPYPPFLGEYSGYPGPDYSSVVVRGKDKRLYQITLYFRGQGDTSPSMFASRVRGSATGNGDNYLKYLFVHDLDGYRFYEASWECVNNDYIDSRELIPPLLLLFFELLIVGAYFVGRSSARKK